MSPGPSTRSSGGLFETDALARRLRLTLTDMSRFRLRQ
jgi:hypothetical protein